MTGPTVHFCAGCHEALSQCRCEKRKPYASCSYPGCNCGRQVAIASGGSAGTYHDGSSATPESPLERLNSENSRLRVEIEDQADMRDRAETERDELKAKVAAQDALLAESCRWSDYTYACEWRDKRNAIQAGQLAEVTRDRIDLVWALRGLIEALEGLELPPSVNEQSHRSGKLLNKLCGGLVRPVPEPEPVEPEKPEAKPCAACGMPSGKGGLTMAGGPTVYPLCDDCDAAWFKGGKDQMRIRTAVQRKL